MRAVQIRAFTEALDTVAPRDVPDPIPADSEVLVQVAAAAINPSDIVNIRGGFGHTSLPRIVGRDFAGVVVKGPPHLAGRGVWGAGGGDLGFTRDGSHAQYICLPEQAVALRPANLSPQDAAASGIPYVTAWLALVDRARIARGDIVLVSGAAGSVGTAAIRIANYAGGSAIALVKDESEISRIDRKTVLAIARSDAGNLEQVVREATSGRGADIALNVVGAPVFAPMLGALAEGGRMCIVSGVAGRVVEHFDIMDFYRRDLALYGINTAGNAFTAVDAARILTELYAGFETQQLEHITPTATYGLEDAAHAYAAFAAAQGQKIILESPAASG
jgi:NADPH:quinone reductase-like Zn-dependent oxidoreductase